MLSQKCNFPTSPSALGNTGPIPDAEDNRDTKIDIAPTHPRRDPSLGVVQPDMTSTAAPTASTDPGIHQNQPSIASTHQNVLPRASLRCWYFQLIRSQTKKRFIVRSSNNNTSINSYVRRVHWVLVVSLMTRPTQRSSVKELYACS